MLGLWLQSAAAATPVTLLSFFAGHQFRTVMVGWRGELTETVLGVALLACLWCWCAQVWPVRTTGQRRSVKTSSVLVDPSYGYLGGGYCRNEWYASALAKGSRNQWRPPRRKR